MTSRSALLKALLRLWMLSCFSALFLHDVGKNTLPVNHSHGWTGSRVVDSVHPEISSARACMHVLCVLHSAGGFSFCRFSQCAKYPSMLRPLEPQEPLCWRFCPFFYLCLFIAPRTRRHTCTRSQRKRRNTSTETEMYVKMPNRASTRDERVHKLFFVPRLSLVSFVRSRTATTTTTTASSSAGSVADCTQTLALGFFNTTVLETRKSHDPGISHAVRVPDSATRAECLDPPASIWRCVWSPPSDQ